MYNTVILSDQDISRKTGAAFSRMYEYARGLSTNDGIATYISSLLIKNDLYALQPNDERIYITGNESIRRSNFFMNRYFCFFRKKRQLQTLLKHFQGDSINTVFIIYNFFSTFWEELFFHYLLKRKGFRVYTERNERSLGITLSTLNPKGLIKKIIFIFLKMFEIVNSIIKDESVRLYDGVIVISSVLENWIQRRNKNTIRIPVLANHLALLKQVDFSISRSIFKIGYTGSISFNRDGVDILIESINKLVKNYDVKMMLTITGYGAKPTIQAIKEKITEFNLESTITLHGYVSNEQYTAVVDEQDMFIVIRRNNLQGRYSFSTKIAEYMALGKLVLTTPVSDNKIFIKDNYNGFIAEDLNSSSIANKIFEIMNLPENRLWEIKKAARKTALEQFNIGTYSNQLLTFLFPINN